jgi:hypothetical protein
MKALLAGLLLSLVACGAQAQTQTEVYGFVMLDMGYQTQQNDPLWFDVLRPTKLPAFDKQFGEDGRFFSGVRQTRFGVKTTTPTTMGDLKTQFEWELFGVGVDAGQTTLRLRHAYGELGKIGAGQTWSPFMDIDIFPNSIEYWGPNGMAFFRNVQVRWMPIQGETRMTVALERPGASGDQGDYADRLEDLGGISPRFALPDASAEYRLGQPWGYVELAGIVRQIRWDDLTPTPIDLSGDATGWGLNLTSNIKMGRGTARLGVVYGEGIQNYMNDAPADVGIVPDVGTPAGFRGEVIPVTGVSAFYDVSWSDQWSSTAGYSTVRIENLDGQADDAFKQGQYALANLLFYPVKNVMLGGEIQWGDRENFRGGFTSDDLRFQFSARYNFSTMIGGQ